MYIYFEMSLLQPEIVFRLVAVATRMSLSLSLFLGFSLCFAGDATVNPTEKNRHDISEGEEGEKVAASPTTTAVTHGWPSPTCRFSVST